MDDLCARLRPVLGPEVNQLWWEHRLNPDARRDIEAELHALAARHLGLGLETTPILLPPPPAHASGGTYPLADVRYVDRVVGAFGLREREWIQHVAVFGRTGSGKTNVGFQILRALRRRHKPFLVFDWKRNYRDLTTLPEFRGTRVITVGRDVVPLAFNPLVPPPGTSTSVWIKKLTEIMCHVYWLGEGVAYLLQRELDALSIGSVVPTLTDLHARLRALRPKGREALWMESTLRAVGTLCYGEMGRVLNATPTTRIEDLLRSSVVLELDALSDADKTFLVEALLLWIHHYRLQERHREVFKHAILIEEAHHVLLRRPQSKESIMDVVFREIRELGEALILFDQHPSLISIPALGNTYTTIAMNLKHGRDVRAIGDALQLTDEQRGYLGRLDVGAAIVRLQGRWHDPFLVSFPLVHVHKGAMTDGALRAQFQGDVTVAEVIPPPPQPPAEIPPFPAEDKGREVGLSPEEDALMRDVIVHVTDGIAVRLTRLGLSVSRGYRVLDSLVSHGLLASAVVATPSGATRVLWPTAHGAEYLMALGLPVPPSRHESAEHRYWKYRIADHLQVQGYEVEIEARVGDHVTDILARRDGKTLAVEIETGKSDALRNLRALTGNVDAAWSVFLRDSDACETEVAAGSLQSSQTAVSYSTVRKLSSQAAK